jgi:adenylate kinase
MTSHKNNERTAWLGGPPASCPAPAQNHPWRLVLLGAPGVGKGTQADLLQQRLGACHLSTGDVFRAAATRGLCQQSPAMIAALGYMRRGELVPDSTVWEMVRERRGCLGCAGGFVLDGFPRTLNQAHSLQQLMEDEKLALDAVVNYELPVAEIVERLSGRRTCQHCRAVYHLSRQPSRIAGICDRCGGKLYQRDDDRPESVTVRMQAYQRSTTPLIRLYEDLGLLLSIAASGSPEEICARTLTSLDERNSHKTAS